MERSRNYLGIDIGATNIRAVRLRDFDVKTAAKLGKWETPGTLEGVREVFRSIHESSNVGTIGVSVAGVVKQGENRIEAAPNMPFLNGVQIRDLLPGFSGEIRLDNDARCFLRAEIAGGAARGFDNTVGIVLGTGIGAAIWKDGAFYVGEDGKAGELGHWVRGGKELEETARELFQKTGDAGTAYAEAMREAILAFAPDLVVLGGGPIAEGRYDLGVLIKKVSGGLGDDAKTKIVFGELGDTAQAIGAALLFQE